MAQAALKQEILDDIENDEELKGKVAKILGLKALSMYRVIKENSPKLIRVDVLQTISEYLNKPQHELYEVVADEVAA